MSNYKLSLIAAAAAAGLVSALPICGEAVSAAPAGSWVVSFEDDFSGNQLNTSNWTPSNYSTVISKYDGHDALFTSDRVAVSDGSLVITTVYEQINYQGTLYNFTSGWIDSQQKVNQTRGRFEASIKMPSANATGAWPAWWLLPEQLCWPIGTEIDIVEYYVGMGHNQHSRTDNPAQMSSSYHYGYSCGGDQYHYPQDTMWYPSGNWTPNWPIIDFAADYHVFGVELNDTAVRFYVDNATNTIFTLALPALCVTDPTFEFGVSPYMPFKPMYGIINVAMNYLPGADLTWWKTNNATTLVDWVRWYEFVPSAEAQGLPADAAADT